MKSKNNFFNFTEVELLVNEDLNKVNGGSTSIAYDIGTLLRLSWQSIGHDVGGAAMTATMWYSYQ